MISVIIPTYNYGDFIADALQSVSEQTYPHWECIVVDDCSTDHTAEVVKKFCERDRRFRYYRLDQNAGVSEARNKGLAEAKGEFIQLLDADDVLSTEKLSIQVEFLKEHPKIAFVYSNFIHFTGTPDFSLRGEYEAGEKISGSGNAIIRRLLNRNFFRLNTVLFRHDVIRKNGIFRSDLRSVEDWEFWLRMACAGEAFYFLEHEKAKSAVRINPRGLSKDIPGMKKYYLPVLQHIRNTGRLGLANSILLWLRYGFVFLDKLLFTREEIIFLPDRKRIFIFLLTLWSIFILPFFLIYKLIRLLR